LTCWFGCLGSKLDLFLHKTCMLTKFIGCLRKIIYLIWAPFLLKFGRMIGLWVGNPKKISLHQMDFSNSRYSSRNGRRSKLTEFKTCLWWLWFPCSFSFIFLSIYVWESMDVIFLIPLESLHLDLYNLSSA